MLDPWKVRTFHRCLSRSGPPFCSLAVCGAVSRYCLVNFLVNLIKYLNSLLYLKLFVHFVVNGLGGYLLVVILKFSVWSEQIPCQSAIITCDKYWRWKIIGQYSDWKRLDWFFLMWPNLRSNLVFDLWLVSEVEINYECEFLSDLKIDQMFAF